MENDTIKPEQAAILFDPDNTVHTLLPNQDEDAEVPYHCVVAAAIGDAIAKHDPRIKEIVEDFLKPLSKD